MAASGRLTIFEIGSLYGIAPRTLMFYEDQGLLAPMIDAGTRYYSARDRIKLELLIKGKRLGFSLIEVKLLILSASERSVVSPLPPDDPERPVRQVAAENLSEEIWKAERQIDILRRRVEELHRHLSGAIAGSVSED